MLTKRVYNHLLLLRYKKVLKTSELIHKGFWFYNDDTCIGMIKSNNSIYSNN